MEEIPKWEYQVQTFGSALGGPKDDALTMTLDEWGAEGWEVISVHNLDSSQKVRVVARRSLTRAARRYRTLPG
jgi:hypothetical protein